MKKNKDIVILDVPTLIKKGYKKYKLKDGSVWLSKGCPKCSKDKLLISKQGKPGIGMSYFGGLK